MNLKSLYIKITGYSYTNMGRLFLRLFIGIMLAQFGIRQWMEWESESTLFPGIPFMEPSFGLGFLIAIELICSFCLMIGFCTRLMALPPMIIMILAEIYLLSSAPEASYLIPWNSPAYLPVMFMGVYLFIILVGPGKISVDYFLSLHFIHSRDASESELEEV